MEKNQKISDLFSEKNSLDIYTVFRSHQKWSLNETISALFFVFFLFGNFFVWNYFDIQKDFFIGQILFQASTATQASISLLGFMIAGFAFVFTINEKGFFIWLSSNYTDNKITFFKENLFTFIYLFLEYLIFSIFCFLLSFIFSETSSFRKILSLGAGGDIYFLDLNVVYILISSSVSSGFIYLLMELQTFLFNIYHFIGTKISYDILTEEKK